MSCNGLDYALTREVVHDKVVRSNSLRIYHSAFDFKVVVNDEIDDEFNDNSVIALKNRMMGYFISLDGKTHDEKLDINGKIAMELVSYSNWEAMFNTINALYPKSGKGLVKVTISDETFYVISTNVDMINRVAVYMGGLIDQFVVSDPNFARMMKFACKFIIR